MPEQSTGKTGYSEPYYSSRFFDNRQDGSLLSAREVVPLVLGMIKVKSVIDVGCGTGTWLSVFKDNQVYDFMGVDGDYLDKTSLLIPEDKFLSFDLREPLRLDREFDLVVSLEVAEHLPEKYAEGFVESLTRLGPVVMFSAAIPYQGGVNHVNEQWQDYWQKLFKKTDFVTADYLRPRI